MHLGRRGGMGPVRQGRSRAAGIERDGNDEAARSFWRLSMAEELPFMARHRPWTRPTVIATGTPHAPHNPVNDVVVVEANSPSLGVNGLYST